MVSIHTWSTYLLALDLTLFMFFINSKWHEDAVEDA